MGSFFVGKRALGGEYDFTDVPKDSWYHSSVCTAASNNIISGIGDNMFAPDRPISRQDACVIIARAIKNYGVSLSATSSVPFDDKQEIALYAFADISAFYSNQLIKGVSEEQFMPKADISRAQAAQLIYNVMSYLKILDI